MQNNAALEILILFLLILLNGVLAMAEIAVVSARKVRLQRRAEKGDRKAKTALALAEEPNQFLATIQIGITLVGTLAGAFGGTTVARKLAALLDKVPFLAPYAQSISVSAVVVIITYFSLVIGELVPKRLALNDAEGVASALAGPMNALSRLTAPLVNLLDFSTNLVVKFLGVKPSDEPSITPDELKMFIDLGTKTGVLEESEQEMIESIMRLDERCIGAVMTPRPEVIWIDLDEPPEKIGRKIAGSSHSRFPVAQDSLDNVRGILRVKDLLDQEEPYRPEALQALLQPPLFVPESMSVLRVLELFKHQSTHIALVTDEYGIIQGVVTHHDILESIVGFIPADEFEEPQVLQRDDGSWLLDGMLPTDELKEIFYLDSLPEESANYQTVSGLMMSQLGSVPAEGQHFEWEGLHFEVVDMDGRRVDKVLVRAVSETEAR
ncbi:MAG: hemolysin family protein [Anaerolineae bacterium]